MWPGKAYVEAGRAYERARAAGMPPHRALVLGAIASYKDCWSFRSTIAQKMGVSVRTVQRATDQGQELGLLEQDRVERERAKTEVPPGADPATPRPCGWCHRFTTGWGQGVARARRLIDAKRASWLVQTAVREAKSATVAAKAAIKRVVERPKSPFQRRMSAEEIDAELARQAAELARKRGEPPPD